MGPKNIRAKGGLGFFRKWRKSAIVRPAKIFPSETPTFELHSLDRPGSIGPRRGGTRRSTLDIQPRETRRKPSVSPCRGREIGRAHVRTPVTNAQLVCRLLLE